MAFRTSVVGTALSLILLGSAGGVFASQQETYDAIADETASIRQLALLEPVNIEVNNQQELRDFVLQDIQDNYPLEDQQADLRALVILGLFEPGTDLAQLQIDLLGEQVAGYYDPETDEMVVISSGTDETLSASDELTFAHETIHALQDQHFDLLALQGDPDAMDDDASLALTALIEGDATTGQIEYLFAHPGLIRDLQREATAFDSSALDESPAIFRETLLFPYDEGADFVDQLYQDGGWEAVDAAYANPPQSTEQILHPESYYAGEGPVAVDLYDPRDALGSDWEILDLNVMGELITGIFLNSDGVDSDEAELAAEGWGGDRYVVIGTDDAAETALIWRSAWDSVEDADEFFAALTQHELRRFDTRPSIREDGVIRFAGDNVAGEIRQEGDEILYLLAPDEATLDSLLATQQPGSPVLSVPAGADATPAAGSN